MTGERAHAVAIKAAITAVNAELAALDYDEAKKAESAGTLPDIYVLITVSRRYGGQPYMSGGRGMRGWRLTSLAVGTTDDEARWAREQVAKLEDQPISALDSTRLRFETEAPIEPDNGRQSGLTSYTYATPA